MTEVASTCRVLSFTVFFLQRDGKREKEREREGGRGSVRVPMADWLDDYAGRPNRMRGMGGVEGRGKGLTMLHHTCIYETGERKANTLIARKPFPSPLSLPAPPPFPFRQGRYGKRKKENKRKKRRKRRVNESHTAIGCKEVILLAIRPLPKKHISFLPAYLFP